MEKYVLSNGLRVVAEKIPTCRSVAVGIWVKVGSRNEQAVNNGISHCIEHMLFKGTERHSAKDIAERFDGIGGNVNAFTSKEYTCYYAKVLDQHLDIAVDVLADMFFHSSFDSDELEKEKNVIIEEIAMYEDTPDDLVHDVIAKAAYGDHSLGYTILGAEQNLRAFTSHDLRGYVGQNYRLDNTVISVAGNIDDSLLALLERHFGAFAVQGAAAAEPMPVFRGERLFQQKQTEQNHLCLSLPGCAIGDRQMYPMIMLNNIVGGGMSSRLFQEIREKRGLAYSIYSYHSGHADSGLFTIYAGTAPKQSDEVLKVTIDMLGELQHAGISEAELRKSKEQLKGSLLLSLESTGSRMNRLGKNELMLGKHDRLDDIIQRIEAVTLDDVNGLCRTVLSQPFAAALVGQSAETLRILDGGSK